jgi:hypothetical protein
VVGKNLVRSHGVVGPTPISTLFRHGPPKTASVSAQHPNDPK